MNNSILNIYYINLDEATSRRKEIDTNLAKFLPRDIKITRIRAIDKEFIEKNNVPGNIRASEKACFLSHKLAVKEAANNSGFSLILEDDACLSQYTYRYILSLLPEFNRNLDIVFTDLCVSSMNSMFSLYKLKGSLDLNSIQLIETKKIDYAGATAYLLNDISSKKLFHYLESTNSFDIPYDLFLKSLISNNLLTSAFTFPFITTLSDLSSDSQIQLNSDYLTNFVWNAFRKLMFIESNDNNDQLLDSLIEVSDKLQDEESKVFSEIIKIIISKKFPTPLY